MRKESLSWLITLAAFGIVLPLFPYFWVAFGAAWEVTLLLSLFAAGFQCGRLLTPAIDARVGAAPTRGIGAITAAAGLCALAVVAHNPPTNGSFLAALTDLPVLLAALGFGIVAARRPRPNPASARTRIALRLAEGAAVALGSLLSGLLTGGPDVMHKVQALSPPLYAAAAILFASTVFAFFAPITPREIAPRPSDARVRGASLPVLALKASIVMVISLLGMMLWETFHFSPLHEGMLLAAALSIAVLTECGATRLATTTGGITIAVVVGSALATAGMLGITASPKLASLGVVIASILTTAAGLGAARAAARIFHTSPDSHTSPDVNPWQRFLPWIASPMLAGLLFEQHERTSFAIPTLGIAAVGVALVRFSLRPRQPDSEVDRLSFADRAAL